MADPTMRFTVSLLFFLSLSFASCKTKLIAVGTQDYSNLHKNKIYVIRNPVSALISVTAHPYYDDADRYTTGYRPSIEKIDSLICEELTKRKIECVILDSLSYSDAQADILYYKDYWAWDFKPYMHILKLVIYDNEGVCIAQVISQGNTAGLHDYPKPAKQVPKLISLLFKQGQNK